MRIGEVMARDLIKRSTECQHFKTFNGRTDFSLRKVFYHPDIHSTRLRRRDETYLLGFDGSVRSIAYN